MEFFHSLILLRVIDCRFFWIGRSRSRAELEHLSRGQQVHKVVLGGVIFWEKRSKMASLNTIIYNTLFRRTSTYVLTMVAGAIVVERIFDHGCDWYWEKRNRGVRLHNNNLIDLDSRLYHCHIQNSPEWPAFLWSMDKGHIGVVRFSKSGNFGKFWHNLQIWI